MENIQELKIIFKYKMAETDSRRKEYRKMRDEARERNDDKNAEYWDGVDDRERARWSAYYDCVEILDLIENGELTFKD